MAPLMRKRDKKKEKAKAEAATKKKKELYTDVNIGDQGKRGKGRKQRVSAAGSSCEALAVSGRALGYTVVQCDLVVEKERVQAIIWHEQSRSCCARKRAMADGLRLALSWAAFLRGLLSTLLLSCEHS